MENRVNREILEIHEKPRPVRIFRMVRGSRAIFGQDLGAIFANHGGKWQGIIFNSAVVDRREGTQRAHR
jgi:hypothetical protein